MARNSTKTATVMASDVSKASNVIVEELKNEPNVEAPKTETETEETETVVTKEELLGDMTSNSAVINFDVMAEIITGTMDGVKQEESRQAKLTEAMFGNDGPFSLASILALYRAKSDVKQATREALLKRISDTYAANCLERDTLETKIGSEKAENRKAMQEEINRVRRLIHAANSMFDRAAVSCWYLKHTSRIAVALASNGSDLTITALGSEAETEALRKATKNENAMAYTTYNTSGALLYAEANKAFGEATQRATRNRVSKKQDTAKAVVTTPETRVAAMNALTETIEKLDKPMIDAVGEAEHKANLRFMNVALKSEFVDDKGYFDMETFVSYLKEAGFKLHEKPNKHVKKAA